MSEEQKIRLGGRSEAPTRIVGPHVDVFLDGEPLPPERIYEANEIDGFVDFLIRGEGKLFWEIDRDPDTNEIRPRLERRCGAVEIRLKDGASKRVREVYEAMRRGTLQEVDGKWMITDR